MRFVNKKSGKFVDVYAKHIPLACALLKSKDYLVIKDADFIESDHPRDNDGKFTSGSGGSMSTNISGTGKALAPISTPMKEMPKAPQPPTARQTVMGRPETTPTSQKKLPESFNKKDLDPLKPEAQKKLEAMYEKASEVKEKFDAINENISKEVNGKYISPPLKGSKRAVEKIVGDYNGDPSKIKDLVRSTIEVKSWAEAQTAIEKIKQKYTVMDSGYRNLLDPNVKSHLFGYRDAKMNVEIDGVVAEMQVNIPEMLEAKSRNHGKYERISTIDRKVATENRTFTEQEANEKNQLLKEMEADYDLVWNEVTKAKNPS